MFDKIHSVQLEELLSKIKDGKIIRLEMIDSPFIENLIQRINAYLMRLGVRDLGEEEVDKMLGA